MSNKKDNIKQDDLFKNIQAMSKVLARYSQQNLALEIEKSMKKEVNQMAVKFISSWPIKMKK